MVACLAVARAIRIHRDVAPQRVAAQMVTLAVRRHHRAVVASLVHRLARRRVVRRHRISAHRLARHLVAPLAPLAARHRTSVRRVAHHRADLRAVVQHHHAVKYLTSSTVYYETHISFSCCSSLRRAYIDYKCQGAGPRLWWYGAK